MGTYYPKNSSVSASVCKLEQNKDQKVSSSSDSVAPAVKSKPSTTVAETKNTIEPDTPESSPAAELSAEIVPVAFDEKDEPIRLASKTSTTEEPPQIPLPEDSNAGQSPNGDVMSLEELESIALANNPAIKELAATTQKAAGFRTQVTRKPNPTVGYQAMQLADQGTDQHVAFFNQEFVTGGKLELNHRVLNAALAAQLRELEAQRLRVTTDIRVRFYAALALQRQLELINDFIIVAENGLEIAKLRKEAGESSQVDVLQANVQLGEVRLVQQTTQAKLSAIWRELSAVAGVPDFPVTRLEGTLPEETPSREWEQLADMMISTSPEYAAAQSRISRARAKLQREIKQPIPNVQMQLGAGVDNATNSGMLNLQFGVPLPIHNDNSGNICAAQAELNRAYQEARRIQNNIKARLAQVSREYDSAAASVNQYANNILPSASSSMDLAEEAYQAGQVSFLQVLVSRKTYYDTNLLYVSAQADLAAAQAKIDGFVLTGALDSVRDESGDDSLRGHTFGQQ
ncbi:MAG: TolC family protein [Planctomycetaceae bacterium]|nr:TolC family protein [Planctomycetaceae bacterium]